MGNCISADTADKAAVVTHRSLVGVTNSNPAVGNSSYNPDDHVPNDAVDAFLKSRGYHGLTSQIELSLSATNLRDMDVFSKSDPMVVIYMEGNDGSLQEIGRTEVILNSLNPQWIAKQTVTYHFEMIQKLLFRVYDVDTNVHDPQVKTLKLEEQQFLGEGSCTLSEIVTKPNRSLTIKLVDGETSTHPTKNGQLIVHAEEVFVSKSVIELIFRCSDLKNKDFFSKTDSFLVISKSVEGANDVPIYKTEVQKNNPNPTWKPVVLKMSEVGSMDSPLTIECYKFSSNGNHISLGKVTKSLAELQKLSSSAQGEHMFSQLAKDHQKKTLKSQLFVDKFSETTHHTFLDYLAGGCELNFMVAIDFTSSNGNPNQPDSLHYIDRPGRLNAYQKAIKDVGEVLHFYDYDKKFPAWGFGARLADGMVSHCFNLNATADSEVEGVEGIMTAYKQALFSFSLAGPTLFGPVIKAAETIVNHSLAANEKKYFVLLIITDGVITDLQETTNALVQASDLPLSLLIVGVGNADFSEMEILDADKGEKLKNSNGRFASRDIVQFVPFRDVMHGGEVSVVQSLLAELPGQFLTYMRNKEILP